MGEAKRRKKLDRGFGKNASDLSKSIINADQTSIIKHTANTKHLLESVQVMGSSVVSIHIMVCSHPKAFNKGFCQIKTVDKIITFWAEKPFIQSGRLITGNREWSGIFTLQIIDGMSSSCNYKFSMKNIPKSFTTKGFEDIFCIEKIVTVKVGLDLPQEEISLQIPN